MSKQKLELPQNKAVVTIVSLLFLFISLFFSVLVFNCVNTYEEYENYEYSDLSCEKLTFEKYETRHTGRKGSSTVHEVYFKEYETPFYFSTISNRQIDRRALNELSGGEVFEVYYREGSHKNYDYLICEMKSDSVTVLSLDEYISSNQSNQVLGIVFCSFCAIGCLCIFIIFITRTKNEDRYGLGRLVIEHKTFGNQIRIYNSPSVCSLMINGKVVDQYNGMVAGKFSLAGRIVHNDRKITVEARMGHLFMCLYVDGQRVGKKFMGFG